MAELGIVRLDDRYFREYRMEWDETLLGVCSRYGHVGWLGVYNETPNAPFRERFPQPNFVYFPGANQSDFLTAPHIFIPLAGKPAGGASVKGTPIGDFFVVRVFDEGTHPLRGIPLTLIAPAGRAAVRPDVNGDVIEFNPAPGNWFLTSPVAQLVDSSHAAASQPVRDLASLPLGPDGLPIAIDPFQLTRNAINQVVARKVFFIACPMCGITFRTIKNSGSSRNVCPNDSFDLTALETEIENNPTSFASPATPQDPQAPPPDGLKCRGITVFTAHYDEEVEAYWDESRFVKPDGGDYTLWGKPLLGEAGEPTTVLITGRATWGAGLPNFALLPGGDKRVYEFHKTAQGASISAGGKVERYPSSHPSNELQPLAPGVLRWITVHHTTDSAQSSSATARALQQKHQIDGIEGGGPAADIGYHFLIDATGVIFEGRPLGIKGSHVRFWNGGHIGIVLAGDFESRAANAFSPDVPTPAALASLDKLVDVLAWRFKITSAWSHIERKKQMQDGSTECPGENLIPFVNAAIRPQYPDLP